ncbi:MAG: hypothetical protein QNJ81_15710 [Acidimicrobiia bacterium]|nr:hypothetical protein [Acidimicrobiia bacterium]
MTTTIRVLALGDEVLRDSLLSRDEGGSVLDQGLAAAVAGRHDGYEATARFDEIGNLAKLTGFSYEDDLDVVILGTNGDVLGLTGDPEQGVAEFRRVLIQVFDEIRAASGAHVLVANTSTFDPADETSSLYGLATEPISMRAHRIDLALLQLSHEVGFSIIDVDRITAEAGCADAVPAALELSPAGLALVRDEVVRVLADYGFFDERSLVAQVGNRGGST